MTNYKISASAQELTPLQVMLRLAKYLKNYFAAIVLGITGCIIYAVSNGAFICYFKPLIDLGLVNRDPEFVIGIPIIVVAYFVIRGFGSFIDTYYMGKVGRGIVRDFRIDLLKHILRLPISFYHEHQSSELISKLNYDTGQLAETLSEAIPSVLRGIFSTMAYVYVMFMINWRITLLLLLAGPVLMYYISHVSRHMRRHGTSIQNTMGGMTHVAREITDGYKEIRTFSGYNYEDQRIVQVTSGNYNQEMKMIRTIAISVPFMQFIGASAMAVLLFLAMQSPDHHWGTGLSAGEFGAMFLAMIQLMRPVKQIAIVNSVMQRGIAAARSIFKVLGENLEPDTGTIVLDRCKGKIEFRNLKFTYSNDRQWQLNNINFTILPGQTVALVGESGAGKTTLIGLLARFYPVSNNSILLDDHDINLLKLSSLREHLAIVSQNVILFDGTIRDNIAYGCNAHASESAVLRAAKLANALEFIEKLPQGFKTPIGENGLRLSGGQRQRLAIARAILKDAPVLILDEATSALDTHSERYIQDALSKLMYNRTTLVIAHRLSTVEKADRIIVMADGGIVESGNFSELMAGDSAFKRLYHTKLNVGADPLVGPRVEPNNVVPR